ALVDHVVPVKDCASPVPGHAHDHRLLDASLARPCDEASAQVMEPETGRARHQERGERPGWLVPLRGFRRAQKPLSLEELSASRSRAAEGLASRVPTTRNKVTESQLRS